MADLVVMAAGLGTRFGGLKQLAPVGPNGEAIIDYAAMRLLGQERDIAEPDLARAGLRGGQDQNEAIRGAVTFT